MDQTRAREADEPDEPKDAPAPLLVQVTRTGGFAGLRRVWKVEPREDEASEWIALIERCPWDECLDQDPRGADRFQWSIRAQRAADAAREAELPDHALKGPWRELVDAVREWTTDRPKSA